MKLQRKKERIKEKLPSEKMSIFKEGGDTNVYEVQFPRSSGKAFSLLHGKMLVRLFSV